MRKRKYNYATWWRPKGIKYWLSKRQLDNGAFSQNADLLRAPLFFLQSDQTVPYIVDFFFFFCLTRRSSPSYLQGCCKLFPIVILTIPSKTAFACVLFVVVNMARPFTPSLCSFPKEDETQGREDNVKSTCYFIIRVTLLLVRHMPSMIQDFLRPVWSTGLI